MLEYVFFNAEPCARFRKFASSRGLTSTLDSQALEQVVRIDEDAVDDALADELDLFYDEMFAMDQSLFEKAGDASQDNCHKAGVVVNLSDGRAVYAEVAPDVLSRVMATLDQRDLADLVAAVVDAVENPDERTFCQRMRDADTEGE